EDRRRDVRQISPRGPAGVGDGTGPGGGGAGDADHHVPAPATGVERAPRGVAERPRQVAGDGSNAGAPRSQRSGRVRAAGIPGLGRQLVDGYEPDELREVADLEELPGIDVTVAEADAEVEPARVVLRPAAPGGADDLAARDAIAFVHRDDGEEGVGRTETAVVGDDDVQ